MTIKNITILGGTGFVGSCLVTKLDQAGYQVKVLSRRRESAKHLILLPNVQVVNCDIADNYALKDALKGSDAVINLVGILHETGKDSFEKMHHQLPRRVAQMCDEMGITRLLHMSALQASKNAPSAYLKSKAAGEAAVNEFSEKLNITVFKPSVIFGRGDRFINMFALLVRYLPVIALAKPNAKFQPIWVEDVAQYFVNALENPATYGNSYELGGPEIYTLKALVQKVMDILGKQRPIIGLNDRLSMLQGFMLELMPIKLMTRDNIRSMQVDNITILPIADELNVIPTSLEVVVPEYLLNRNPRAAYDDFRSAAGRAIKARR
ncbi:MAG TPA: complex I NDUFA9 subunit family protein [Methylotenera sp.]|nr:complex I NDUFA9 subunit family protein [Methylotenera sp.]